MKIQSISRKLSLSQFAGEGNYGKLKIQMDVRLPDYSPIITIDKKKYLVPIASIVEDVIAHHEIRIKKKI